MQLCETCGGNRIIKKSKQDMNSTSLVGRYNILNNKWGVFYTPNGCRISVYTRVSGGNGSGIAGTSFGEVSQEVFEMIDDVAC